MPQNGPKCTKMVQMAKNDNKWSDLVWFQAFQTVFEQARQVLPVGKEATANHEEKEPEEILPFTWRSPNPKINLVLLCICS